MNQIKRICTGIMAVDSMIEGGIPKDSIIGLYGPAGVGKSIFALQFVLDGAKSGEKSVYINLEEPRENIDRVLKTMDFGKEFEELEKAKKISVLCLQHSELEKIYDTLFRKIGSDSKIKRLVIDSFNCFFSYCSFNNMSTDDYKQNEMRKILAASFSAFRRKDLTTMLILEDSQDSTDAFSQHVPFLVDGIIKLDFISLGCVERRIFIPKMRWTRQYESSLMYEITKKGIVVKVEKDE